MSYPLELILKTFVSIMCFTPNIYIAHGFELLPTGLILLAHLGLGWNDFVWIELVPIILGMIVTILAVHISRPQKVKSPENVS